MIPVKILIIEDNNGDYDYICELLKEEATMQIKISRGKSLKEAEKLSFEKHPDLVLLDLGLPDSFGLETLETMVNLLPNTPIIVLTGFQSYEVGVDAIKEGAQDFLSKNDLTTGTLLKSIEYSLERKKFIDDYKLTQQRINYLLNYYSDGVCVVNSDLHVIELNKSFINLFNIESNKAIGISLSVLLEELPNSDFLEKINSVIKNGNHQLFDYNFGESEIWYEIKLDPYPDGIIIFARDISANVSEQKTLNELNESLQKSTDSTISLLTDIIELKEPYTAGHQERSATLCELISDELNIPRWQKETISFAARIHDIGKTAIPAEILSKPTSLSKNEMNLVHYHVESGYNLVKKLDSNMNLSEIILQHHERIDGSGYPNGIVGKDMLIESKILAVADVVDAMLSHRPYRSAFSTQKVIKELEDNKSILYDTDAANACIKILKLKKFEVK